MSILHELIAPKDDADDVFLVREIYFNDGDKVLKDTELIDLETSKTVVSIDSPVDGFVEYIVELGNTINVVSNSFPLNFLFNKIANPKPIKA